jgi:hypothetical protein
MHGTTIDFALPYYPCMHAHNQIFESLHPWKMPIQLSKNEQDTHTQGEHTQWALRKLRCKLKGLMNHKSTKLLQCLLRTNHSTSDMYTFLVKFYYLIGRNKFVPHFNQQRCFQLTYLILTQFCLYHFCHNIYPDVLHLSLNIYCL